MIGFIVSDSLLIMPRIAISFAYFKSFPITFPSKSKPVPVISYSILLGKMIFLAVSFKVLGKKFDIKTENINILEMIPYESENKYSAVFYEKDGDDFFSCLFIHG